MRDDLKIARKAPFGVFQYLHNALKGLEVRNIQIDLRKRFFAALHRKLANIPKKIGKSADMIHMRMRNKNAAGLGNIHPHGVGCISASLARVKKDLLSVVGE